MCAIACRDQAAAPRRKAEVTETFAAQMETLRLQRFEDFAARLESERADEPASQLEMRVDALIDSWSTLETLQTLAEENPDESQLADGDREIITENEETWERLTAKLAPSNEAVVLMLPPPMPEVIEITG